MAFYPHTFHSINHNYLQVMHIANASLSTKSTTLITTTLFFYVLLINMQNKFLILNFYSIFNF